VWCRFDELTADALQNRLLKATLIRLLGRKQVPPSLAKDIRKCIRTFDALGVKTIEPTRQAFRRVQPSRNNSFYAFLLHICALVHEGFFPEHDGTAGHFALLLDDETRMNRIFERFVRNFFRHEQNEFEVKSERIPWDESEEAVENAELLPGMYTDASLRNPGRTVIVETKYYSETLHTHYERKTLRCGHLYQLFAYVKNLESRGEPDNRAEGILLYPAVHDRVKFETTIQGHRICARTVDLSQPWGDIRTQLLSMIT
jgi:5-methylcytosine-specific restriction enzyme subunit McrC